jgi:hypothetical protein
MLTSILRISFHEDGGNGFLRNVVKFLSDCGVTSYTAVLVLGVQLLLTFTAAKLFLTFVPATPSYSCTVSLFHCCAQRLWFIYKGTRLYLENHHH